MKIKSIFTLICSIILTLCLYSVAFAANAKTEAVSFLQQATKNTVEAQNAAYSINLSMTGPLADCSIDLNGSYAYPVLTSGDMSLALDLWIIDTTFEAQTQYYSELEGNVYKQYFKTQADPKGAAANVSPKINSDQWYVQSVSLPENFVADYAERTQKSINDVADDVKNIFMYDVDDKTAKVYVTYKKPILDEEKLNEALNLTNLNEKEMAQVAAVSQKLEENTNCRPTPWRITSRIASLYWVRNPLSWPLVTRSSQEISKSRSAVRTIQWTTGLNQWTMETAINSVLYHKSRRITWMISCLKIISSDARG